MKKEKIIFKNNVRNSIVEKKNLIKNSEKGLLKTIVIVIIAVLLISYFDIDMKALMSSDTTKSNFSFVGELLAKVWDILKPVWDSIWESLGPIVKNGVKEGVKSQL